MWDEIKKMKPIEQRPDGKLFRLTPKQARRVWRLVKLCCNNVDGDCLPLDDGEGCTCPQSLAYTLICKYFRRAVLPSELELEQDIFNPKDMCRCTICSVRYIAGSGRSKILPCLRCRGASQAESRLRPKKEVERRQLTPQKAR